MSRIHLNRGIAGAFFLLLSLPMMADKTPQESYIEKYSGIAVAEMYRSGVPASITLAQGMLESGNGLSALALEGNNHFGIKCHDWTGEGFYQDDDRKNECFRKYASAEDSFKDHSDFLRNRSRYQFLFDLAPDDYKGWAYGLKHAGYATDPSYPRKLIKLIEDYDLDRFDAMTPGEQANDSAAEAVAAESELFESGGAAPLKGSARLEDGGRTFRFSLSREQVTHDGVPYICSAEGESYYSIAKDYGLFKKQILKYNEATEDSMLAPGTVVYLGKRK